jgi:hypothetical protein
MTQGRNKWGAVVYRAMKIWFPLNAGIFFEDKESFVSGIFINIIIFISFMYGNYNYIPETNLVYGVHSVAAVLYLQCVVHVMLFRP